MSIRRLKLSICIERERSYKVGFEADALEIQ